jgi:hypothetical protein
VPVATSCQGAEAELGPWVHKPYCPLSAVSTLFISPSLTSTVPGQQRELSRRLKPPCGLWGDPWNFTHHVDVPLHVPSKAPFWTHVSVDHRCPHTHRPRTTGENITSANCCSVEVTNFRGLLRASQSIFGKLLLTPQRLV